MYCRLSVRVLWPKCVVGSSVLPAGFCAIARSSCSVSGIFQKRPVSGLRAGRLSSDIVQLLVASLVGEWEKNILSLVGKEYLGCVVENKVLCNSLLISLQPSSMAALNRLLRSAVLGSSPVFSAGKRGFSVLTEEPVALFSAGLSANSDPDPTPRRREDRNVQWVFLGCPGVGKGTFASRLSQLLGVPHIATGDLVREELASSGPLSNQLAEIVNQGKLVSDKIIINLLSKRLESGAAKGESGFILDGFPRTVKQAEILDGVTDVDLVVNLKLREDVLLDKCLGRRTCSECGGNFNVASIDAKAENGKPAMSMAPLLPPAKCMSKLITRADDTEEVVKKRLHVYNEMSQPVEEFYRLQSKLLEFNLPGGLHESWPKLLEALNIDDHDDKRVATA